uniref:Ig-like domain-containing protein n=1 Tax=Oreochromis niloticus TaxID=8128 RepID=A0A669BER8_ORENI
MRPLNQKQLYSNKVILRKGQLSTLLSCLIFILIFQSAVKIQVMIKLVFRGTAILPCHVTDTRDDLTQITWQRRTREKPHNDNFITTQPRNALQFVNGRDGRFKYVVIFNDKNGTLQLSNVALKDEGSYTCIFTLFPSGNQKIEIPLNFLITVTARNTFTKRCCLRTLGRDICSRLMCQRNVRNFLLSLTSVVFAPKHVCDTVSSGLSNVALKDEGSYTCIFTLFPSGTQKTEIPLKVFVPPITSIKDNLPTLGKEEVLFATCTAAGSKPPAEVRWLTGTFADKVRMTTNSTQYDNGTTTTVSSLFGVPTREINGRQVRCDISGDSLTKEISLPFTIQFIFCLLLCHYSFKNFKDLIRSFQDTK